MSDMNQAILYNKQSARVLEKLYGVDNPQTAHAYSTLALLYYTNKNHQKAFDYMLKSLYVFNTVGGEFVSLYHFFHIFSIQKVP
jgi:Tetratricopeptide repeat